MHIDLDSPKLPSKPVPLVKQENQPPPAPFPNMGGEGTGASPLLMKAMLEARGSQPAATPPSQVNKIKPSPAPTSKGASPAIKPGSPAVKTGSPAPKAVPSPAAARVPSPAVKTGSPVVTMASPVIKTSASANVTPKPAARPTPTPPPPAPAPITAPAPAPASAPVPASAADTTTPATDSLLADFFDLTTPVTGPTQSSANPEMNFTDMHFSLDTAPDELSQNKGGATSTDDFDMDSFTNDLIQGDAFSSLGQAEAAPMDITMTNTGETSQKQPQSVPDANMDDIFNLDGTSLDMGMSGDGSAMDVSTSFDDLYYQGAETSDFDESFFKV